ncbi:MAG: outer membrane lipoprotein carrier protein LolA [Flavobacteriales bacterium]|nr:outer membrane lipoprotein carrier protein LolA [Flavobacteriales bacterium]
MKTNVRKNPVRTMVSLSLLLVVFATSAFVTNDKESSKILQKVSKTYKSFKTIKATFKINIYNKQDKSRQTEKGTLYVKGKKFRVEMGGQDIYCDGKTLWTYLKDANEVQISNYNPKNSDINPSEIFTVYEKGFLSKFIGEGKKGNVVTEQIELTPTDKKKPFYKVKLTIDKMAKKILDMTVLSKNGMESLYEITSFNSNIDINDNFFRFDKSSKPGVVEINLR